MRSIRAEKLVSLRLAPLRETYSRQGAKAQSKTDTLYLFSSWCGVNLMIEKTAPCGSLMVEKRPTFSISIGGTKARAPNEVAF